MAQFPIHNTLGPGHGVRGEPARGPRGAGPRGAGTRSAGSRHAGEEPARSAREFLRVGEIKKK